MGLMPIPAKKKYIFMILFERTNKILHYIQISCKYLIKCGSYKQKCVNNKHFQSRDFYCN